jgi:peptidoglycan hydrolase-like protein with peptidoglycan-binding domain
MSARFSSSILAVAVGSILLLPGAELATARDDDDIRQDQEMLIWTGDYDGVVDGIPGAGTREAIKSFQKRVKHSVTGTLTAEEAAVLRRDGAAKRKAAGLEIVSDPLTGISVGIPHNLVSGPTKKAWGQNWFRI